MYTPDANRQNDVKRALAGERAGHFGEGGMDSE
jgi:hypothetical protein